MRVQVRGQLVTEDQIQQRRDDRLGQDEAPGNQESHIRMKTARTVGVEPARGRKMLRQLPDADGAKQTCDEGEQNGERDTPSGVGNTDDDGEGDGGRGSHVGDGLE